MFSINNFVLINSIPEHASQLEINFNWTLQFAYSFFSCCCASKLENENAMTICRGDCVKKHAMLSENPERFLFGGGNTDKNITIVCKTVPKGNIKSALSIDKEAPIANCIQIGRPREISGENIKSTHKFEKWQFWSPMSDKFVFVITTVFLPARKTTLLCEL